MNTTDNSQEVFLIYLDELDQKAFGKFRMTDIKEGFVFLQTPENTLMIPTHRILKIKKPKQQEQRTEEKQKCKQ